MAAPPNIRKSHMPNVKKATLTNTARSAPGTTHNKLSYANRKGSKKNKNSDESEEEANGSDDEGLMASTFPHYCDRCGTQMHSATASYYLYCSDQCSRGDGYARATGSGPNFISSLSSTVQSGDLEQPGTSGKRYVPKAKPTALPSSIHSRIPPYNHEANRDLDPTEWKPAERDRIHGPKKRITLINPYDFSQGYTELSSCVSRDQEEDVTRSVGIYPASMPNRRPTRGGTVNSTPQPEIMRRVPSLSRASTLTASSSSSTESRLSDELGSFVPPVLSPKVGVANVSVSTVSVLEGMEGLKLEESQERYSKYPVHSSKRSGGARGSLKSLLEGKI